MSPTDPAELLKLPAGERAELAITLGKVWRTRNVTPNWSSGRSSAPNSIAVGQSTGRPEIRDSLARGSAETCRRGVTYRVVFRPHAEEEACAARRWYEEQQPGLGERFADAIDETVQRIGSNPSAFPLVHGEIRRAVVR